MEMLKGLLYGDIRALYKRMLLYGDISGTIKERSFMEMFGALYKRVLFYGDVRRRYFIEMLEHAPLWRGKEAFLYGDVRTLFYGDVIIVRPYFYRDYTII